MAAKKYIAINEASTGMEERDLLKDVGEFAYANQQEITAPFDVHDLAIGSYKFVGDNWDDVLHPPIKLPSGGHFKVFVADNSKEITYTVAPSEEEHSEDCTKTRSGSLVITDGDAEEWMYYAQGSAVDYGRIRIPTNWDQGKATDLEERVYSADHIDEMAWQDRGEFSGAINFNRFIYPGLYLIKQPGGFAANKSKNYPPSKVSDGILEVKSVGCRIFHDFLTDDAAKTGLLLREKGENGTWSTWYTANEGDMIVGTDKVRISTYMRRGVGSGKATVEVYKAGAVDANFTYKAGYAISISPDKTISWTGTIGAETDPTVPAWVKAITAAKIAQWDSAYSWGNHASLYSLLGHTHTWTEITGKPTTFTPSAHTHPYTEVTGIVAGTGITYIGGVIASTITQYTNAMARAAISADGLLSYNSTTGLMSLASVPWASITGAPDFGGAYVPLTRALTVEGTSGRISVAGGAQTLAAARTWTVDLAAIHAGLSGGSTTKTLSSLAVDIYGRTASAVFSDIAYPVTSVNGQTGAVVLTTSHIAEGTNLYWTNARGDARYSLLGHGHAWSEISGKPTTFTPSAHTHPYTEVTGIVAGTGITYIGGVIASTITQYTNAMARAALSGGTGISYNSATGEISCVISQYSDALARAAISAGGLLSYNSSTGVMSLSSVPWANITGAPDFGGLYVPLSRAITVAGTSGRVSVAGGAQTLAAARTWTVDLEAIHSGLTGGSTTKTLSSLEVDIYGRTVSAVFSDIAFPAETDPTVPSHVKSISTTNISNWNAKADASGTPNTVAKFTAGSNLGNSQITDDGTYVKIGATSTIGKLGVAGAIWASSDASAVSYYVAGGGAIRSFGTMYLDAYEGDLYLRTGGYTQTIIAKSTGQVRFPTYTSSSSWSGTAAGLLAFDSSGNILTYEAVRTNAQNDARYLQSIGSHGHIIGDVSGLQSALDGKANWGDIYTRTQLNTSGGGGQVHWDNIIGEPPTFPPTYHTHSISEVIGLWGELDGKSNVGHGHIISDVSGLQSALDGKTPYGHGHIISDVSGLQSALDNRPTWDNVYTRTQLNTSGAGGVVHWDNVSNKPGSYNPSYHRTNWSDVDGAPGFLTYETDPVYTSSSWYSTTNNAGNWNTAYGWAATAIGWGNHASAGYLTGYTETDPTGVAWLSLSYSGGYLYVTIGKNNGSNVQANVYIGYNPSA